MLAGAGPAAALAMRAVLEHRGLGGLGSHPSRRPGSRAGPRRAGLRHEGACHVSITPENVPVLVLVLVVEHDAPAAAHAETRRRACRLAGYGASSA